jgi:hypothetical protein
MHEPSDAPDITSVVVSFMLCYPSRALQANAAVGSRGVVGGVSGQSDDPDELVRQAVDELALETSAAEASRGDLDRMSERLENLRRDANSDDDSGSNDDPDNLKAQRGDGDGSAPLSFRCPISREVMTDPVTTADGQLLSMH